MAETKVTRQRVEPTPGPWEIEEEGPQTASELGAVDAGDKYFVISTTSGEWSMFALVVGEMKDGARKDECLANARLIAVAPDLLFALHAACTYITNTMLNLRHGVNKQTIIDTLDGGFNTLMKVIDKAEGTNGEN